MHHQLRPDFAKYSYTAIGFPKVVLKWHEEGLKIHELYIVIDGVIGGGKRGSYVWRWQRNHGDSVNFRNEFSRFDEWVRQRFADDPSVQG